MNRYTLLLKRPLQLIPVLFGISLITFLLLRLAPGDPVRMMLGPKASEDAIAFVRSRYGLDHPILLQYVYYVRNAAHGDFGQSIAFRAPVWQVIAERIAPTVYLLAYALVISLILTIALSVTAAWNRGRRVDHVIRFVCVAGIGIPTYFLGLVAIMLFCVRLKWFPVSGYAPTALGNLWHLFLPALTVAIGVTPILTRNLRANLVQQLDAGYAIACRSKGLPEQYLFMHHVLRNSLLPTVTLLGVVVAFLIGSTVVIENVFNIPGLGNLLIRAVLGRDYYLVQAVTLLLALGVVIVNFAVDVLVVTLDPRVGT